MNNGVADLISPMGRALQSNMQSMTPDQFTEMAKQYVANGMLSWSDLLSIKSQYDRMKQAPQGGPPPTTTVVQDMQQQMGGGLASLPSNIGNEASYARGGVVAFDKGGSTSKKPTFIYGDDVPTLSEIYGPPEELRPRVYADPAEVGPKKGKASWKQRYANNPKAFAKGAAKGAVRNLYIPGVGLTAWGDVFDPVPTENMREYYRDKGLTFIDPVGDSLMGDLGVRALGTTQRALTLGLTGPQRDTPPAKTEQQQQAPPDQNLAPWLNQEAPSPAVTGTGGGIASLVGRPDLSGFDDIRARLQEREAAAQADVDKGRMGRMGEIQADYAALGIGNAAKEGRERLAKQETDLAEDTRRGKWLSAAEGFFGMAEAAGQGGTFMGAAAAGGAKGLESYNKLLDRIDRKKDQLDEKNLQIAQMEEQLKLSQYEQSSSQYNADVAKLEGLRDKRDALAIEQTKLVNEYELKKLEGQIQQAVAQIYAGSNQQLKQVASEYYQAYLDAAKDPALAKDPAKRAQVLKQIADEFGQLTIAASGSAAARVLTAPPNPYAGINMPGQGGVPQATAAPGGISFVGSRPE